MESPPIGGGTTFAVSAEAGDLVFAAKRLARGADDPGPAIGEWRQR